MGKIIGGIFVVLLMLAGPALAQTSITNDLTWGASAGAVDYIVERETDGAGFTQIAVVAAPGTTYQDALLPLGSVYSWRILARNGAGTSAASNACSTVTIPPPAPGALTCTVIFNP
jgi:hypothetical protein